ncbi:transcriptional repressor [Histoplasma ohiense]|nr:transcriptional repressor [Histoplasma ohiense (nom. inval.)]
MLIDALLISTPQILTLNLDCSCCKAARQEAPTRLMLPFHKMLIPTHIKLLAWVCLLDTNGVLQHRVVVPYHKVRRHQVASTIGLGVSATSKTPKHHHNVLLHSITVKVCGARLSNPALDRTKRFHTPSKLNILGLEREGSPHRRNSAWLLQIHIRAGRLFPSWDPRLHPHSSNNMTAMQIMETILPPGDHRR